MKNKYSATNLICEAHGYAKGALPQLAQPAVPATTARAAIYYVTPYFLCAPTTARETDFLPETLYLDDNYPAMWELVCAKRGRSLYRTLDGNPCPSQEPLQLDDPTFNWFIGPQQGDVNDIEELQ